MLVFVPGLIAVGAASALGAPRQGELLVWGIDGNGWRFLATAAAFLLLCIAICWVAVEIAAAAPRAWRTATGYITCSIVATGLLLIAWPAFIIGALSFSSEYRTIDAVDGQDLVVRRGIGLGDSSLQVGLRHGAFVEFGGTTGDTLVHAAPRPFADWSFSVRKQRDQITIHYTFTPGGSDGTLLFATPR